MKKLILFIAFALLFTIFSCTPDEYETQTTKKVEKPIDRIKAVPDDGPGDKGTGTGTGTGTPPPPPPVI
ncbi:hypothetical protein [Flavobacterium phragmitis]|uniref:Uncharacterized protein n=1 Tax=Flavobacterium phragmitis TaxID=739143 RepID=A0A1I1NGR2_9FLAO|nr:hypothetical protein [Flavobacterium phragmitis]SFC96685.1 hypothetical protein SAMN05216297_103271 [Flavobacterium phragmitis]